MPDSSEPLNYKNEVRRTVDEGQKSKARHVRYYRSLGSAISDMAREREQEEDPVITEQLAERIRAMQEDRKRVRRMFPDVTDEEWDGVSD